MVSCSISSPALSIILNCKVLSSLCDALSTRTGIWSIPFFDRRSDCESQRIFLAELVPFCQYSIQVVGVMVRALSKNCIKSMNPKITSHILVCLYPSAYIFCGCFLTLHTINWKVSFYLLLNEVHGQFLKSIKLRYEVYVTRRNKAICTRYIH